MISKDATSIYSTCLSVDSAGYCDLNLLFEGGSPLRWGVFLVEDGVEGVRTLLTEPRRGMRGILFEGTLFRVDVLEAVRVEGKDDREACRLPLALPEVPLVPGL